MRSRNVAVLAGLFTLLLTSLSLAQCSSESKSDDAFEQQADAAVQQRMAAVGPVGVSIEIDEKGTAIFAHGFGDANFGSLYHAMRNAPPYPTDPHARPDASLPSSKVDVDTIFPIGSISKQFTAAAILQLSEAKRLRLTDPIGMYLPALDRDRTITIQQLLWQTSGLPDFGDGNVMKSLRASVKPGTFDAESITRAIGRLSPLARPGASFHYSNLNYFLLGCILERASGQSIDKYFQDHFFGPLGMSRTSVGDPPVRDHDEAVSYTEIGPDTVAVPDWDMRWASGSGNVESTVVDLSKWDLALVSGRVVSARDFLEMTRPGLVSKSYEPTQYADGLVVEELDGRPYVWHNGGIAGFKSMNALFPQDRLSIVVLSNNAIFDPEGLAKELYFIFRDTEATPQP